MKLRNKKTGEIIDADFNATISGRTNIIIIQNGPEQLEYHSLAELNEEWEDYEEPKDIWWLDNEGNIHHATSEVNDNFEKNRQIGNYFKSKEEAEKAVEKLKAWKRLKDVGFKFTDWRRDICEVAIDAEIHDEGTMGMIKDLELLFGGEE